MYTYTLNAIPVTPVPDTWEIEHVRNKGQIFFRRKLSGDIIFKDDDYDYLLTLTECTELEFIIYCNGAVWWTGIFKYPYDFYFDTDACFAKGTPQVVDEYSCIMDKYDTEWNYSLIEIVIAGVTADIVPCGGGAVIATLPISGHTPFEYLEDIVSTDVQMMHCELDIVSSFFLRDEFPGYAAGHYASIFGTDNYVTGDPNRLEYIYMWHNGGVRTALGGTVCVDRHKWKLGFKYFESLFRDRFNAYWFIDSDGKFRIEHISYFLPGFPYSDYTADVDLTAIFEKGRSYAYRRNKYEYRTDELFDQEKWEWQHYYGNEGGVDHFEDFQGVPIFYGANVNEKADCVPGEFKEKKINTPNLWSDIEWAVLLADPDEINCNGFFICDIDTAPIPDEVMCEVGLLSGNNVLNGHCSTANLMEHYFKWDRIFLNGNMNDGNVTVFTSAIKKKLQDKITFPMCCDTDFDAMDYVTTEMGDGAVYSAVQKPRSMEIQLLYD